MDMLAYSDASRWVEVFLYAVEEWLGDKRPPKLRGEHPSQAWGRAARAAWNEAWGVRCGG